MWLINQPRNFWIHQTLIDHSSIVPIDSSSISALYHHTFAHPVFSSQSPSWLQWFPSVMGWWSRPRELSIPKDGNGGQGSMLTVGLKLPFWFFPFYQVTSVSHPDYPPRICRWGTPFFSNRSNGWSFLFLLMKARGGNSFGFTRARLKLRHLHALC
jgi:hypothetical protein